MKLRSESAILSLFILHVGRYCNGRIHIPVSQFDALMQDELIQANEEEREKFLRLAQTGEMVGIQTYSVTRFDLLDAFPAREIDEDYRTPELDRFGTRNNMRVRPHLYLTLLIAFLVLLPVLIFAAGAFYIALGIVAGFYAQKLRQRDDFLYYFTAVPSAGIGMSMIHNSVSLAFLSYAIFVGAQALNEQLRYKR